MDKQTFCGILRVALLNYDGVTEQQLTQEYKIEPELAKAGIRLCKYLKPIEFNQIKGGKNGK